MNYCHGWPDELKQAEAVRFRSECRLRNLMAQLDTTAPENFEALMQEIEAERTALLEAQWVFFKLFVARNSQQYARRESKNEEAEGGQTK